MTSRKKETEKVTNLIDEGESVELKSSINGVTPDTKLSVTSLNDDKEPFKTHEKPSKSPSKASNSVGVYLTNPKAKMPVKGSDEASCYDLYSFFEDKQEIKQIGEDNVEIRTVASKGKFTLYPHARVLVPTGVKLDIPKGYDVRVYPRSGFSLNNGVSIVNSLGVIDSDYRGEVGITLINHTNRPVTIESGMRLAQMEINKLETMNLVQVEEYDDEASKRSTNGFGSTGVK